SPGANANLMRRLIDQIRKSTASTAVMLFAAADVGKVTIVAGVSKSLTENGLKAGDRVKEPAALVGGSGGGRPDMAQAGGKDAAQIPAAITKAEELAKSLFA